MVARSLLPVPVVFPRIIFIRASILLFIVVTIVIIIVVIRLILVIFTGVVRVIPVIRIITMVIGARIKPAICIVLIVVNPVGSISIGVIKR